LLKIVVGDVGICTTYLYLL